MRHRQDTVVERGWDGEFETSHNGRDLDHNPRTGVPFSWMLNTVLALLSKILLGRGTITLFQ